MAVKCHKFGDYGFDSSFILVWVFKIGAVALLQFLFKGELEELKSFSQQAWMHFSASMSAVKLCQSLSTVSVIHPVWSKAPGPLCLLLLLLACASAEVSILALSSVLCPDEASTSPACPTVTFGTQAWGLAPITSCSYSTLEAFFTSIVSQSCLTAGIDLCAVQFLSSLGTATTIHFQSRAQKLTTLLE